ncbi:MAG: sulfite exporter TauE/SafE family protein [Thermodesulfovibrionales bacterium]|nr:sulfite exporter TauE/SafE family protein [Thermodesulfovibrionales bacterium]
MRSFFSKFLTMLITSKLIKAFFFVFIFLFCLFFNQSWSASANSDIVETSESSKTPWWVWPIALFVVTFILGIVAVLGGVGGGVLFVPIVGGFFPFHLDFVRGAGLLIALAGAIAAGPGLLAKNLADLRLAMPFALIASTCAIVGAMIGLSLPTNLVQIALGISILFIVAIMLRTKKAEYPEVKEPDALSTALKINGIYYEISTGHTVKWKIHRTPQGLVIFIFIGLMAGMFGLGAGWANVPVLNLLLGVPLKVSVATSKFLLSITDTSAAWVYINNGAVLPIMVVPSIIGIMLGSLVGVKILSKTKPAIIRTVVIIMLLLAGFRAILKGVGLWT